MKGIKKSPVLDDSTVNKMISLIQSTLVKDIKEGTLDSESGMSIIKSKLGLVDTDYKFLGDMEDMLWFDGEHIYLNQKMVELEEFNAETEFNASLIYNTKEHHKYCIASYVAETLREMDSKETMKYSVICNYYVLLGTALKKLEIL